MVHLLYAITWVLARLLRDEEREAFTGDLLEEYALRAAASTSAALRWYLRQLCGSVLPLLWARLAQLAWVYTLGVALLAYLVLGLTELAIKHSIAGSPAVDLATTFPAAVLIAYGAAWLRRGAPVVLAAIMLTTVALMTLMTDENLPLGYRVAYFVVGPAAVFLGSRWRSAVARRASL